MGSETKLCRMCGATKLLVAFWADRRKADGRQTRCADCANRRRAETKRNGVPDKGPLYTSEDRGHATPCWVWRRGKTSKGYGAILVGGKNVVAHRWVYESHLGPIPGGQGLDHLCRQRDCVNPGHLEPVTNAENIRRGKLAKLNHEKAAAIRASTETYAVLSAMYGVGEQQIWKIKKGLSWLTP